MTSVNGVGGSFTKERAYIGMKWDLHIVENALNH
jgi:hypothetical protein